MIPVKRMLTSTLLWAVLVGGVVNCSRSAPLPSTQTEMRPRQTTIALSPLPSSSEPIPKDVIPVDDCDYVRLLRETCYKDGTKSDWFKSVTALSLAQCSVLPLVLSAEPLKETSMCLRNLKSTEILSSGEPPYCSGQPVTECVTRVLEARSGVVQEFADECRDLGRVCGSQPRTFRSDVCRILNTAITPSYRKQMRACLSWNCDNADCVSELLFHGRIASQSRSNVPPPSLGNSPCTAESGFPRVVTVVALENYGQCPQSYGSVHQFLWFQDSPPEPEFSDECENILRGCNTRRLKMRRTDVPMNLTMRPCRTALWATKPKHRKELSNCMTVGCNAADCLFDLASRYSGPESSKPKPPRKQEFVALPGSSGGH
jgi:hypothetical protein